MTKTIQLKVEETNDLTDAIKNIEKLRQVSVKMNNTMMSKGLKELKSQLTKIDKSSVESANTSIEKIQKNLSSTGNFQYLNKFNSLIEQANRKTINWSSGLSVLGNKVGGLFNTLWSKSGLGTAVGDFLGIYTFAGSISSSITAYNDMIETSNLFEVSLDAVEDEYGNLDEASSKYYTQALAFQDEMNSKLLTNESELKKYQAQYYSMLTSAGIDQDSSYFMSEQLTKSGYDIASLWNEDISDLMNKQKSALTGQVKSMRDVGVDVSEASLQSTLDSLGIDKSIENMSYAEKMITRYISMLQQASQAQGDFARTMESPANSIKILKNQFQELLQVAGSFAVNTFQPLIVYVTGLIMALKTILRYFASLFGYDMSGTGIENLGDEIGDVSNELGDATDKAKALKKQLMGFDEINNITPNTSSGSGSGSGGTGIDSDLLNALQEWDNKMSNISDKATEIRDKILDWLGFDTQGQLEEGLTNFEKILEVVKTIGITFLTWKVTSAITSVIEALGLMTKGNGFKYAFGITLSIAGIYLAYKGMTHILNGDIDLFTILETLLGTVAGAFGIVSILKATKFGKTLSLGSTLKIGFGVMLAIQGVQVLSDGIQTGDIKKTILGALELTGSLGIALNGIFGGKLLQNIKNGITGVKNFSGAMNTSTGVIGKHASSLTGASKSMGGFVKTAGTMVGGLAGIAVGSSLTYATMKDFTTGTIDTTEAVFKLTGGLATATASGVLAGSQFGVVGMAIGGVAGLTTSAITTFMGYKDAIQSLGIPTTDLTSEIQSLTEELDANRKAHEENVKSIKDTYENQLVETEYAQKLSEQLNSLVDVNGKVKEGNEERVKFILGELNGALGTEYELNGNIISQNGEVVDSYKKLQDSIKETIEAKKKEAEQTAITELYKESIKEQIKLERDRMKAKETFAKAEIEYNNLMAKGMSNWTLEHDEDCKKIIQNYIDTADALNETRDEYKEATENVQYYSQQMTDNIIDNTGKLSDEMIIQGQISSEKLQEIVTTNKDEWEKTYNGLNTIQQSAMLAQSTTLDTWSPLIQEKWSDMATNSKDLFVQGIESLDVDTSRKIVSTIEITDENRPAMAEAWKQLATKSKGEFNTILSTLDTDTQNTILGSITTTENLTGKMALKWYDLAKQSKENYNEELSKVDEGTKSAIEDAITRIGNLSPEAQDKLKNLADTSAQGYNAQIRQIVEGTNLSIEDVAVLLNNDTSIAEGMGSVSTKLLLKTRETDWNTEGTNVVTDYGNGIYTKANSPWFTKIMTGFAGKIASFIHFSKPDVGPLREFDKWMPDMVQGLSTSLDKASPDLIKTVRNMSQGIADELQQTVTVPKTFIDTTQYVDYGTISGNISANSEISISNNIINGIAQAVGNAIQNQEITVDINAKTEKGTIVETTVQGIKDYVKQTGELPFPIPV